MTWASLILAALKLISSLADYLSRQQLISLGESEAILKAMKENAANAETAHTARLAQRSRDIGGVHDDNDPFLRP